MKESILKRIPGLHEDDILLRDDGNGPFIDVWNSSEPKPTIDQVMLWHEEDMQNLKPIKSLEEQLAEEQAKTRRMETQLNQTNADLQGFMDFYFMNQPQ